MVIRIFYLVVSIFSVAMVYLAIEEPYYSDLLSGGEVSASMQMSAVTDYEMNATAVNARYEADTCNRYKDRDECLKFKGVAIRGDKEHNISSDEAIYQEDLLKFKNNVRYINNENLKFVSNEATYDIKKKIAISNTPFVMTQNGDKITGNSLVYDLNLKTTKIKGFQGWIEQERR